MIYGLVITPHHPTYLTLSHSVDVLRMARKLFSDLIRIVCDVMRNKLSITITIKIYQYLWLLVLIKKKKSYFLL